MTSEKKNRLFSAKLFFMQGKLIMESNNSVARGKNTKCRVLV